MIRLTLPFTRKANQIHRPAMEAMRTTRLMASLTTSPMLATLRHAWKNKRVCIV